MAEEIIIKVDGLQELKNIEATFKTFVTSINAAVTAIGAAGGTNSLSGAIGKVTAETKKHSQAIDENKVKQQQLNAIEKERIIASSEYSKATEKLLAQTKILQREIDSLVKSGQTESALYREKTARLANMTQEYDRLQKATGLAQMKQTGMYGATYQLSQVMRELPNFAIDARIGFLSLSNNLPMLLDSFKQLSMEIDSITGKPKGFKGAMEAFGKSLFGLNTVFVVATTLLTIYGEDIVKFVKGLFVAEKQIKNTTTAFSELNSVVGDGLSEYKNAVEQINKVKSALNNSENGLKIYNNIFGETLGTAKSVAEALDIIKSKEAAYVKAMQKMAIANAMFSSSAETAVKIADISTMSNAELLGKDAQKYISAIEEQAMAIEEYKKVYQSGNYLGTKEQYKASINQSIAYYNQLMTEYNNAAKTRQQELISDEQRTYDLRLKLANKYYKESNIIAQNYALNLEPQSNGKQSGKSLQQRAKYGESDFEAQNLDIFRKADTSIKNKLAKDREDYSKEYKKTSEGIVKQNQETFSNVVKSFYKDEEGANKLLEQQKEDTRQSQLETLNSLGSVTDSIAGLYDARIQKMNDYYDMEAARIEGSTMSEQEKNEALKRLDEKRYQEELKLFEQRKKFQIATVWIDAAAGIMNAWTTKSTTPSPWDVIERVAKSAAIVAMAVTQTANINAQKPNAPKSISSGGSATGMTATQKVMSPQKTAMTSSEENLNMMLSNREKVTSVVKVSEINNVQNRVAVRENNQMY